MQLNPMHLTVGSLLQNRLFRIPDYQRAYSWGTRQRKDLFADIIEIHRSGQDHFMATVVTLASGKRTIDTVEHTVVELVDGQQRITTIILLLKAIEKAFGEDTKIKRDLGELLVKDDRFSVILLQTNHDSSTIFSKYLCEGTIVRSGAVTAADHNLVDAVEECETFVAYWLNLNTLESLTTIVRNKLSMIYHELSDEATVYRVFEVLNSRGLDVKWIDKLKSQLMALIFEHAEENTRAEAVVQMHNAWKDIYRRLGVRGNLGDEALRFAGTWALDTRPNRVLGEEDAAAELTNMAGTEVNTISNVGARLRQVVYAVHQLDANVRLRAVTRIAHARFVATAILLRNLPPEIESNLLGKWERVTFRIFGLGGADTRHKIGDYVRLGYDIQASQITPDEIIDGLEKLGEDYSMEEIIGDGDYWLYSYDGWTEELRYLLYRFEEHLSASLGGSLNQSQWNKIWLEEPSRSIEHIEPQSSGLHYVHHLGNLTMLPPKVNSSLKDKPPTEKAKTYKLTGLLGTTSVATAIDEAVGWTEKHVLDRAALIETFVRKEWAG